VKIALLTAAALTGIVGAALAQEIGNPAKGQQVFNRCIACHKVGPNATNGIGPVLNGIVGRRAGAYPGYNYTEANATSNVVWDVETLKQYLPAPRAFIPDTRMIFPGLSREQDVLDVIAYLAQFDAEGNRIEPGAEPAALAARGGG